MALAAPLDPRQRGSLAVSGGSMRKPAIIAILYLLAGCQSTERLQATVGNASNFQLCRAIFLAPANVAGIASAEAQRRSLDCRPYASAVFQDKAQSDAAIDAYARQLLTPPAPMQNNTMNCRTVRMGDVLQTNCR